MSRGAGHQLAGDIWTPTLPQSLSPNVSAGFSTQLQTGHYPGACFSLMSPKGIWRPSLKTSIGFETQETAPKALHPQDASFLRMTSYSDTNSPLMVPLCFPLRPPNHSQSGPSVTLAAHTCSSVGTGELNSHVTASADSPIGVASPG